MAVPNCFGSGNKKFLKAVDVNSGDLVKFVSEGRQTLSTKYVYPELTMAGAKHPKAGMPKEQFEIEVSLGNGEVRTLTLNKTSYSAVASKLGFDTKEWMGRVATVTIAPTPNGKKAIYLSIEE